MSAYADTAFIVSLFLLETTSSAARRAVLRLNGPLPLTSLAMLELQNTFNLAIARNRITPADRDALWRQFETQIRTGFFAETAIPATELHEEARRLSDRYTPTVATRTLDLLHVGAAILLGAREFYSFDERQRRAAAGEGLRLRP